MRSRRGIQGSRNKRSMTIEPGRYRTSVAPAGSSASVTDPMVIEGRPDALKSLFVIGSMGIRGMRVIEHDWDLEPFQGVEMLYQQIER